MKNVVLDYLEKKRDKERYEVIKKRWEVEQLRAEIERVKQLQQSSSAIEK